MCEVDGDGSQVYRSKSNESSSGPNASIESQSTAGSHEFGIPDVPGKGMMAQIPEYNNGMFPIDDSRPEESFPAVNAGLYQDSKGTLFFKKPL